MALILLIIGAVLYYTRRFSFGSYATEGRHVRAAGAVLMLPAGGAMALSLLIGLFFGANLNLALSLLALIGLAEFLSMFVAVGVAYILLFNPAGAPRLPGILGQIQAETAAQESHIDHPPQAAPVLHSQPAPSVARDLLRGKKIMTLDEAAVYLGMTPAQVERLIDDGRLAAARANYRYQIARSQLDDLLAEREREAMPA
jgi:excisionase family DNA binding protein